MKITKKKKQNNVNLVTKQDLKSTENFLNYRIDTVYTEVKELKQEFTSFKDSVLKTLDWLVGAFKKFDEGFTVMSHKNIDTEKRVESIEKKLHINN